MIFCDQRFVTKINISFLAVLFTGVYVIIRIELNFVVNEIRSTPTTQICLNNKNTSDVVPVNQSIETMEAIETLFAASVSLGGKYEPGNCAESNSLASKQRIAIIIPFRDRQEHLKMFLRHMHPFLQRQQLKYTIFVIEMDVNLKFNRAILMNIGFAEAIKLANYTCFVFHDVDLVPEDNRIPYHCAKMPQHLAVAIDKFNYTLVYDSYFGGVSSITAKHFRQINGCSNLFFGWGGEDDDFYRRIYNEKLKVVRPSISTARYKMLKHKRDENVNPLRFCLLKFTKALMHKDGLNTLQYTVKALEFRPLYTWLLIQVNETDHLISKFNQSCKHKDTVI